MSDEFLMLACLGYDHDNEDRRAAARRTLAAHPSLSRSSIYAAAAIADAARVGRFLESDPRSANAAGGPYNWPPLCYLTYARHDPNVSEEAVLATADVLLDNGADPNGGFLWEGLPTPFTALTGAFGEGELGPVAQPRHPHSIALARRLLEAGADPNDGQALYNRMFGDDNDHLELLFEFGLGEGDGGPWYQRQPGLLDPPSALVRGQLRWAVTHGQLARVQLVADHGVDLATPFDDGHTAADLAALNGDARLVTWLAEHGGGAPALTGVDAFVAAALVPDRAALDALMAADPGLLAATQQKRPSLILRAVVIAKPAAVALLAELGFDVNAKGRADIAREEPWQTALHEAASTDNIAMMNLLLSLGADPSIHDRRFDATPLGWAEHFSQTEQAALLRPLTSGD